MLELEEFARLQSAMERASSSDEVLRAKAITAEQWLEAERRWLDAFAKEIDAGSCVLAERYLAAYLGDVMAQPSVAEAPEVPAAPPPQVHVPSYLRMGGAGASALATPPVVSPTPVMNPSPQSSTQSVTTTVETPTPKVKSAPTLPFRTPKPDDPKPSAEPSGPVSSRSGRKRRSDVELPPHVAALKGRSVESGRTEEIDHRRRSEPPLPFQGSTTPPSAGERAPPLSPEQFAWIVATVESTHPSQVDAVLLRMRMTSAQYAAMGARWQAEMRRDAGLAGRFGAALAAERARRRGSV